MPRIDFIRSKLSKFSAHVQGVKVTGGGRSSPSPVISEIYQIWEMLAATRAGRAGLAVSSAVSVSVSAASAGAAGVGLLRSG